MLNCFASIHSMRTDVREWWVWYRSLEWHGWSTASALRGIHSHATPQWLREGHYPCTGTLEGLALLHLNTWRRRRAQSNDKFVLGLQGVSARPRFGLVVCCKLHGSSVVRSALAVRRKAGKTAFFTHDRRRSEGVKITTRCSTGSRSSTSGTTLEDVVGHVRAEVTSAGRRRWGNHVHYVVTVYYVRLSIHGHPWESMGTL